jgi:hypothetical protein
MLLVYAVTRQPVVLLGKIWQKHPFKKVFYHNRNQTTGQPQFRRLPEKSKFRQMHRAICK